MTQQATTGKREVCGRSQKLLRALTIGGWSAQAGVGGGGS